ncbi:hypothetical protein IAD21_04724 [Abditibacteriota bacterium]|nr:hypothetical protein IAD21_04724 [Abditibacteriota bacterium]
MTHERKSRLILTYCGLLVGAVLSYISDAASYFERGYVVWPLVAFHSFLFVATLVLLIRVRRMPLKQEEAKR